VSPPYMTRSGRK